jgi:hypothetical protein
LDRFRTNAKFPRRLLLSETLQRKMKWKFKSMFDEPSVQEVNRQSFGMESFGAESPTPSGQQ